MYTDIRKYYVEIKILWVDRYEIEVSSFVHTVRGVGVTNWSDG